ncbi:MAG: hypothetical protein IPG35_15705 [Flavobacteriales bacterium]|jgi:hypothetical protein|nr:hypothetical protein [Flavobacteriales bacterium]MBK9700827.1 hypothetical protein [Flavobacteriales bacterium]
MNRLYAHLFATFAAAPLCAQWDVPVRIALSSDSAADRRATGLAAPAHGSDGLAAGLERTHALTWLSATGTDSLVAAWPTIGLPVAAEHPRITLLPDTSNHGPVTLTLPGTGAVPIVKYATELLDSADLQAGIPIDLVYDGAAWQVISPLPRPCPPGMFPASRDVCMERLPTPSSNFFSAANGCANRQRRMCTFGEWIAACTMPNGILLGSIVDYEWVDHAANSGNDAKSIGLNNDTFVPDCYSGSTRVPLTVLSYRCCADR